MIRFTRRLAPHVSFSVLFGFTEGKGYHETRRNLAVEIRERKRVAPTEAYMEECAPPCCEGQERGAFAYLCL